MQDYEKRYRELRAAGLPGWAGDCHAGNRLKLAAMLDDLQQSGLLPPAPCPALELGCGNAAMAALLLAERGYGVHGIDISPTAIGWAHQIFKAAGLADSGGQAKQLVRGGTVTVNREIDTRPGRKLRAGDCFGVRGGMAKMMRAVVKKSTVIRMSGITVHESSTCVLP